MSKYEEAKEIAQKILELEKTRKQAQDEMKPLKDELLAIIQENPIDSMFDFQDGVVFLNTTTSYKIADGLLKETEVKSKSPDKISDDFIGVYFKSDLKLSKVAKMAISEGDSDLLAVLVPEEKQAIKITLA